MFQRLNSVQASFGLVMSLCIRSPSNVLVNKPMHSSECQPSAMNSNNYASYSYAFRPRFYIGHQLATQCTKIVQKYQKYSMNQNKL